MARRRGRKPARLKKVAYELIDPQSAASAPMYQVLSELVFTHHHEIREARIALAWCTSWKPDVDGRVVLGKCKKASDLDRELAAYDFIILLNREFWQAETVTPLQRRALLDHELTHAAVTDDKDGEPKVDERGRMVYRLRRHDLEEFAVVAERYGCYKRDLEDFARALGRAQGDESAWLGYQRVRDHLVAVGVEISLETVLAWSVPERHAADEWARIEREVCQHGATVHAQPPAHVRALLLPIEADPPHVPAASSSGKHGAMAQ